MFKRIQFLVNALVGVFVLSALVIPTNDVYAFTYSDNKVEMPFKALSYSLIKGTYTLTDFSVTSGQDPDGYIYTGLSESFNGNNGSMTFRVGREGSSQVADWFKSRIPGSQTTFNTDPGKLNFAFIGTLKLVLTGGVLGPNQDTYTLKDIGIAQGRTVGRNNWWFGGKNCDHISSNTVTCIATSSSGYEVRFEFRRGGNSVDEIVIDSIYFPSFHTTKLQSKYVDENIYCVWQPRKCPPFVTYYNNTQTDTLKLTVKNNLLYNSVGELFDTRNANLAHSGAAAIFVMNPGGTVYASNVNVVYLFHHSTILAGRPVAGASELMVIQGVIKEMTNCSGHYRPSDEIDVQVKEALKRQGYSRDIPYTSCSSKKLLLDLDYIQTP